MTTYRCANFDKHQVVRWAPEDPWTGGAPKCPECGRIMDVSPPGDPNLFNPVNSEAGAAPGLPPMDPRGLP